MPIRFLLHLSRLPVAVPPGRYQSLTYFTMPLSRSGILCSGALLTVAISFTVYVPDLLLQTSCSPLVTHTKTAPSLASALNHRPSHSPLPCSPPSLLQSSSPSQQKKQWTSIRSAPAPKTPDSLLLSARPLADLAAPFTATPPAAASSLKMPTL